MKKIGFKKIFPRIGHRLKAEVFHEPVDWHRRVIRDWRIIVLCFALILIALSLFAWQIYLSDQIAGGYLSEEITFFRIKSA